MKILLVSNMYPSEQFPSYGVFVQNTEAILQAEGFEVDRAVMTKQTSKAAKAKAYAAHYANIIRKGLTGGYDFIYVHYAAHNAFPLLQLKKLKPSVRIVTNVHGSDVVPEVASQEKFQPNVKRLLQQSTAVITPSRYYEGLVKEKYAITNPIHIFPSGGVNAEIFRPQPDRKNAQLNELGLDPAYRYFGYVGRMDVGKGWDHLLNGFKRYVDVHPQEQQRTRLIMVGSGKDDTSFFALREQLGLEEMVIHFPLMKHADLAKVYNVIELFIFPTTRKGESLGLVGLEAMACGTPILASRIGGILDYVEDGKNSWLFEPGNPEALVTGLAHFNNLMPEQQAAVSAAALQTSGEYELSNVRPKLSAIFNQLSLLTKEDSSS